jgi:hypothetical protein
MSRREFLVGLGETAGAIGLIDAHPSLAGSTRRSKRRSPNVLYVTGIFFALLFADPGRPWKEAAFTRWGAR